MAYGARSPPQPVHTFKGTLAGREDTRGRFNLTGRGVEGVVFDPEGWVYLEPLRNYLPSASAGELVVYRHPNVKPGENFQCGVSLPERLQRGGGSGGGPDANRDLRRPHQLRGGGGD